MSSGLTASGPKNSDNGATPSVAAIQSGATRARHKATARKIQPRKKLRKGNRMIVNAVYSYILLRNSIIRSPTPPL